MKIYFVRHGHPNYQTDQLTELGHRQAAAYTAELFGLEVVPCDFIREIGWGPTGDTPLPANGHPWTMVQNHVANGETPADMNWRSSKDYVGNQAVARIKTVTDGLEAELVYESSNLKAL